MKLTIVVPDNKVMIDGYQIKGLDLSGMDPEVNVVQWDLDNGHEELIDNQVNLIIDLTPYQDIIDAHALAKDAIENPVYTIEELVTMRLSDILTAHNIEIMEKETSDPVELLKKFSKLSTALRKEAKGSASQSDKKVLDDNDLLDIWYDDMETAREVEESWVEDQDRTEQELIDYDTATIVWPDYPL